MEKWAEMLPSLKATEQHCLMGFKDEQGKLDCLDYFIYQIGKNILYNFVNPLGKRFYIYGVFLN